MHSVRLSCVCGRSLRKLDFAVGKLASDQKMLRRYAPAHLFSFGPATLNFSAKSYLH
jgi:hypothetical protein